MCLVTREWNYFVSKRCGLIGESVSLWGWGVGFEVSNAQARPRARSLFLLAADPDVELSVTSPAPRLPARCAIRHPTTMIMD